MAGSITLVEYFGIDGRARYDLVFVLKLENNINIQGTKIIPTPPSELPEYMKDKSVVDFIPEGLLTDLSNGDAIWGRGSVEQRPGQDMQGVKQNAKREYDSWAESAEELCRQKYLYVGVTVEIT